jgi:hypothetical protein
MSNQLINTTIPLLEWDQMDTWEHNKWIAENLYHWSNVTPKGRVSKDRWYGFGIHEYNESEYGYQVQIREFKPDGNFLDAWNVERILEQMGLSNVYGNHLSGLLFKELGRPLGNFDIAHALPKIKMKAAYLTIHLK